MLVFLTRDAGGAVDEDEDHATEGPCNTQKANAIARPALDLVAYDSGYGDVEEEQGGYELGYEGSVEGPPLELIAVDERSWWWVHIVLPMVVGLSLFTHFFGHFSQAGRERSKVWSFAQKSVEKELWRFLGVRGLFLRVSSEEGERKGNGTFMDKGGVFWGF